MGEATRWFFLMLGDGQAGPLTVEEVIEHVQVGRAGADTAYWEEGLPDWEPLVNLIPELGQPPEGSGPRPVVVAAMSPNPANVAPVSVSASGRAVPPPILPVSPGPAYAPGPSSAHAIALQMRRDAQRRRAGASWVLASWVCTFLAAGLALFQFQWLYVLIAAGCALVAVVCAVGSYFFGRGLAGTLALLGALLVPAGTFAYVKLNHLSPFGLVGSRDRERGSVVLSDETIQVKPDKITYSATVTNKLDRPVRDVVVIFELVDADGKVVSSVAKPVASAGPLPAGASARVEIEAEAAGDVADPRSRVTFAVD
jgi:hypothetical protein